MRICFLAPSNSAHTKKWCQYFLAQGHEVHVVSFCDEQIPGATVHHIPTGVSTDGGDGQKLKYLLKAWQVRKAVRALKPDVLNVHYATSYGAVAALAGLNRYALSVWGSDIYDFPKRSIFHRCLLRFSLWRAKYLFSTSRAMAEEAGQYTSKPFSITPFGVDLKLFSPDKREKRDGFVIGTVKALAPAYGIDTLLNAAALLRKNRPDIPLQIRIAGKGSHAAQYQTLADELGISDITCWLGFISQQQAAWEWANMDVAVVCSNAESFGVSAVEAQACGRAVIISDVPGLMEATNPGRSSLVVPKGDEKTLAETLAKLYDDPKRAEEIGKAGRAFVEEHYELTDCFRKVEALFENMKNNH